MKVLITGGTGFIGRALCHALVERGDRVWVYSRQPKRVAGLCGPAVGVLENLDDAGSLAADVVINLAGESIAGGLWTRSRKQKLRDSRIALTDRLCESLSRGQPPAVFVTGSATGFYGDGGNTLLTEQQQPCSTGFAQQLCADWERSADHMDNPATRIIKLRIGLVMGPGGGFLAPLKIPFKLALGGRLGSGQQWMSWISRQDLVNAILFLIDNETCAGAYNAVAPQPVTNAEFTRELGNALHRPTVLPVPAFVLKTLLGELSSLLLEGQRAIPARLQDAGFNFVHENLAGALREAI